MHEIYYNIHTIELLTGCQFQRWLMLTFIMLLKSNGTQSLILINTCKVNRDLIWGIYHYIKYNSCRGKKPGSTQLKERKEVSLNH